MSLLDRFIFEVQFGEFFGQPVWYDLGSRLDLEAGPLTVTRGRQAERTTPSPGRLSCRLVNDDGALTPGNASSPYSPYVLDGAPVRVGVLLDTSANLLDNSSFEAGIGEWSTGGSPAPAIAPSTTHVYPDSGGWSMLVTWGTGGTLPNAGRRVYGLAPGRQYTFSAYVWVPTGDVNVNLALFSPFTVGAASSVHDAFTRISVTWTATSTSHDVVIGPATSATAGDLVWVDAMQLEEGASATALAPGSTRQPVYFGQSLEWPFAWSGPAALAAQTQYVATDLLRRLPRRDQLRPMVIEEALLDSPLTLLPLDEADGATQAGNLGSVQATGTLVRIGTDAGDTYTFGAGVGPPADGSSSLVLTPTGGFFHGWAVLCQTSLFGATQLTAECWFNTTVASGTLVFASNSQSGSTAYPACILFIVGGQLQFGTSESFVSFSAATVSDGLTHHAVGTYVQDGSTHRIRLYLDGVQVDTDSISSSDVSGKWAQWMLVGGSKTYSSFAGTINHAALYSTALSAERVAAHYHAGADGFGGERSDARISRLASYAGLASLTPAALTSAWVLGSAAYSVLDTTTILAGSDLNLEVGSATVYGQSGGGSDLLAEMNAVADTEGGIVLVDRDGQLELQARSHRYNRSPAATVDSADVDPGLSPTFDDAQIINDATATLQDGAKVRVTNAASVAQRGTYGLGLSLLTRDPLDGYSTASFIVAQQGDPTVRYPSVAFDLATLPAATVNALLALDVGDRLDVTGLPPQAPSAAEAMFVEGYELVVSPTRFQLTLNTTPAAGWQVWQLDSLTLSILDSTTILAY